MIQSVRLRSCEFACVKVGTHTLLAVTFDWRTAEVLDGMINICNSIPGFDKLIGLSALLAEDTMNRLVHQAEHLLSTP